MEESFGKKLQLFVLSVDIVDNDIKVIVRGKIQEYLEKMEFDRFLFLVPANIENSPGLKTELKSNGEEGWMGRIKDQKGQYLGQITYAYDKGTPIWIVGNKKERLVREKAYVDLWNQQKEIPNYSPKSKFGHEIRTSIYIPVSDENRIIGIVNYESTKLKEWNPALKEELLLIAGIIRKLYQLHKNYTVQKDCTRRALDNIVVPPEVILPKPKPHIFLASSKRANDDVITLIKSVLKDEYKDKVEMICWDEQHTSGSINNKLLNDIKGCEYGICYFSERFSQEPESKYRDNPNVLIEAGMFVAPRLGKKTKKWIPIRESEELHEDDIPFDIRDERFLQVERKNGTINKEDFKVKLRKRLDCILSS